MIKNFKEIYLLIIVILGIFIPTSINGNLDDSLIVLYNLIFVATGILWFIFNKNNKAIDLFGALLVTIIIFGSTICMMIFNPGRADLLSLGVLAQYANFIVYTLMSIGPLKNLKLINRAYDVIISIIVAVGICNILNVGFINQILIKFYSYGYKELVSNMIRRHKPVTFFASHSLAAFIYFLLIEICLCKIFIKKSKKDIVIVSFLIVFLLFLKSNTSIMFIGLTAVSIVYKLWKYEHKVILKYLLRSMFVVVPLLLLLFIYLILPIIASKTNGVQSRFSSDLFAFNLSTLAEHPFVPSGFLSIRKAYYIDFGYLVTYMRGGILLILAIIGVIYEKTRKISPFILIAFLVFELGYPVTMYARFYPVLLLVQMYYKTFGEEIGNEKIYN